MMQNWRNCSPMPKLRRSDCAASAAPALSADWVTGADNPRLRGAL